MDKHTAEVNPTEKNRKFSTNHIPPSSGCSIKSHPGTFWGPSPGQDSHPRRFPKRTDLIARLGKRISLLITVLLASMMLLVGCGQKPTINLYDGTWDSIWINNAIFKFIVENGYGYPVVTGEQTESVLRRGFEKGEIDLAMEMWQQDMIDWYTELMEQGIIINLGLVYERGPQFWIIPKWVAEQYNIETVFDMKDHWQLFKNPENPLRGVFYNCIIGWECSQINIVKLQAYGLDQYFEAVTPGSALVLEAALARAQEKHHPAFGYYWSPTTLMGSYDWHILKEPPYSDACWEKIFAAVRDKSLRPIDHACAYEDIPIDKVIHKDLLKKAPDVVDMLTRMVVGVDPLNNTAGWAKKHRILDWEKAAVYYLQNYEDHWKTWVPPAVYVKIKKALKNFERE